jgi:hypothetical protein
MSARPDIEEVVREVRARYPLVAVAQLEKTHPADDDGLWFFRANGLEVQLESSSGSCPFLIESNAHDRRIDVWSVEEALGLLSEELGLSR